MNQAHPLRFRLATKFFGIGLGVLLCLFTAAIGSEDEILSVPYPEPSTNAALHYNRALLSLSMIPLEDREVLSKPIWEAFGNSSREEIAKVVSKLVHEGRHAIRAARRGSDQQDVDFGIDYADYASGAVLPHADPMLQLGRLITLVGIDAQIRGEWNKAAILFFQALRIGRHMTFQPTLGEALVGVEILENNYYALAFWGARCPERQLVERAFLRLEMASHFMVSPSSTLAYEASIIERRTQRLTDAFPDGPWAEMLLESVGEFAAGDTKDELEQKAIAICVERNIPEAVFKDKTEFTKLANKLSQLQSAYYRACAACLNLPPVGRLKSAKRLVDRFEERFRQVGDREILDPQQIGSYFSTHDAELTMARVALAIAASRTEGRLPATLEEVASKFSGKVPTSPYDGSPLEYQVVNEGKDFSLVIPEVVVEGATLPKVEFTSAREK